jgi:hypothetical protein
LGKREKRTLEIREKTLRMRPKGPAWRRAKGSFDRDIEPIVNQLKNAELDEHQKIWLENYLIIRLVSIMENFFRDLIQQRVDEYNLSLNLFFQGHITIAVGRFNEMLGKKNITRGTIVANEFNFANYKEINDKFTDLLKSDEKFEKLGMDFFSAVKKIDWYDPYRIFKGAKSMNKNWDNFQKVFDIRNDIVHNMADANLSISQIASMSDNALNVMDAASYISMLSEMDRIIRIMKSRKTAKEAIRETFGQYRRKIWSNIFSL